MMYKRVCKTLATSGYLTEAEKPIKIDNDTDYYESLYLYNEEQLQQVKENKGSVAGITEVVTNKLVWDFDNKDDLDAARQDAVVLCARLMEKGIPEKDIQICFSGKKGFAVQVDIDKFLTVKEFKNITAATAKNLATYDTVVNNASRIIRVPKSKHNTSGLFKLPITLDQLTKLPIKEIPELAKSLGNVVLTPDRAVLPDFIYDLRNVEKIDNERGIVTKITGELSLKDKPKFLTNCRWALQNGYFGEGNRNSAFMVLAATYKNFGFDLEHTYRFLKGVAQLQCKRHDCERYSDEELYKNVVKIVYADSWKGGQYSCREPGNFLFDYCKGLGDYKCDHTNEDETTKPRTVMDLSPHFKDYITHIEKNTIITGIDELDKYAPLTTGVNCGIIGAPGSGKTSICLDILRNTSQAGVSSVFASLDMHSNRMFEKIMYGVTGMNREQLYRMFKEGNEGPELEKLKAQYGNVNFFNKSSPTVADIKEYILNCQEKSGNKIKLVMLDYFERVASDMSEDTAASKKVAGELQDLVNELDIALVTLVQPNKMALSGGPNTPILEYHRMKGSSYVYQAFRVIISLWRPFYHPKDFSNDKYMQMAILKNDLGELREFALKWDGPTQRVSKMEDYEYQEFQSLLKHKEENTPVNGYSSF